MPVPVVVLDRALRVVACSSDWARAYGLSGRSGALNQPLGKLLEARGRPEEALKHYELAERLRRNNIEKSARAFFAVARTTLEQAADFQLASVARAKASGSVGSTKRVSMPKLLSVAANSAHVPP